MSGKGGVGKSLVAGLLACRLRRSGLPGRRAGRRHHRPQHPQDVLSERRAVRRAARWASCRPRRRTGIEVMSINLLLESEDQAVIWRGPLISGAIRQFWGDVLWGELDYLVVDLPPGTVGRLADGDAVAADERRACW